LFQAREQDEEEREEVEAAQPEKKKSRKNKTAAEKADRKKVSHARKVGSGHRRYSRATLNESQQDPQHIPRPRNAFILFRKHVVDSKLIPTSVEIRHQNVSIITAKMWSEVGTAESE
jgi:HMG box factor